ncbi:MAG: preQ(1) synthase [Planctomycetota bacterium]
MPNAELLETFETPLQDPDGSPIVIEHVSDEFTSVCPKTGHPDFGSVTLRYEAAAPPEGVCVELKSLKLYYQSFRDEGIFYEAVTCRIAEDLQALMQPRWLQIVTDWRGRGGIRSVIRREFGDVPEWYRGR